MMPNVLRRAPLTPITDAANAARILNAASDLDFDQFQELATGGDIAELSSNTEFEGVEVLPEGLFETNDNKFEASATVYVTLNYGGKRDKVSMPDSYAAIVRGTMEDDQVKITEIEVDTSGFYE